VNDVGDTVTPGDTATFGDVATSGDIVTFVAPDGAVAECHPPFPGAGNTAGARDAVAIAEAMAADALADRVVGVLLVRLGGYAAGVFTGSPPRLVDSKTGSRLVHGRSAAGGWSQHRFARRRELQSTQALHAAADAAAQVWGRWGARPLATRPPRPENKAGEIDAVVLGGDKRAMARLWDDPRLASYLELAADRFLTVPDPKHAVLADSPRLFLAIRIWLTEGPGADR